MILHVVDTFGSAPRHHVAQATWGAAYADGMVPVHTGDYQRDAKTELRDPLALPFLKDILQVGRNESSHADDVICWTNGDIGWAPGATEAIGRHVRQHGAASMRRIESNGKRHPGRDLFAFTAKFLREYWDRIPDYVIGAPVFDLGLVALIRKHHRLPALTMKNLATDYPPADMPAGYVLHESHASEWNVKNVGSVPSVKWNKVKFLEWSKQFAPELRFSPGGNLK